MDGPDGADIDAAADGDVLAFGRIVRTMQGRVWRYIVLLVRDHALAEDLTQEVFLRVYRKLDSLDDRRRFVPWVLTIARNAAYDSGRSRLRRPVELVGDRVLADSSVGHDPHISAEIHDLLDRLEPSLREAILLVTVVGLTYEEASAALEVPEGTVKSRVFRARKRLVELMEVSRDE